jgi:glycerol-3-phosphate responsive antiterminator
MPFTKKIIFIDSTSNCTHNNIKNVPIGGSEYQLYNFIEVLLSNNYKIICYNKTSDNYKLDNIVYTNYENIKYANIKNEDIIIIQRMFPTDINVLNKIKKNKIYFWIHDLIESKIFLNNNDTYVDFFNKNKIKFKEYININFVNKSNIHYILNSNFTKISLIKSHTLSIFQIYCREYNHNKSQFKKLDNNFIPLL